MSKPTSKKSGFKMFPFEWRERAMKELSPAQFKLWSYLWWSSGKSGSVTESNKQLGAATNLHHSTVKEIKKYLRDNGWMTGKSAHSDEAATVRAAFPGSPTQSSGPEIPAYGKRPIPAYGGPLFPSDGNSGLSSKYASIEEPPSELPVDAQSIKPSALTISTDGSKEAAVDDGAAAAALAFVHEFYFKVHKTKPTDASGELYERYNSDLRHAQYVLSVCTSPATADYLLDWVLAHEEENFSWRKKTPSLACLARFVSKGWGEGLLKQFSDDTGATPDVPQEDGTCRSCGAVHPCIGPMFEFHCFHCWYSTPSGIPIPGSDCPFDEEEAIPVMSIDLADLH